MQFTQKIYAFGMALFFALLVGIVIFHGHLVVTTPYGRFSYDSLNYADVARNIVEGRGITQSAVGFNEARFSPDLPVPMPMISQPPLYPLLAALLGFLGIPVATGTLVVTILGMGLVVLSGFWLARQLYGDSGGLLAGIGMLAFAPLYFVSGRAWTDTLATGLTLLTLALLVSARRDNDLPVKKLVLAGLAAGLTFATRYAFLPVIAVGLLVLANPNDRGRALRSAAIFLGAVGVIMALVLGRNMIVDGTLIGSPRHPSTRGLFQNIADTYLAMFGTWPGDPYFIPALANLLNVDKSVPTANAIALILAWIALLMVVLALRGKLRAALWEEQRFVLLAWILVYLAVLILQRTQFHFDNIRSRLVFPASVTMVILLAGLAVEAFSIRAKVVLLPALLLAAFAFYQAGFAAREQAMSLDEFVDRSIADQPALIWLEQNTSPDDLIIGDNPVDVVFYLDRTTALSFSAYPYSDYLEYRDLMAFLERHCVNYRNIYLFTHELKADEATWMDEFGPFITDLAYNRIEPYPNVILRMPVEDALIYQLRCP